MKQINKGDLNTMKLISFSVIYSLLFWFVLPLAYAQDNSLSKLISSKKGYEQNAFPPESFVFDFTVVEPGLALVPTKGGVYMAGLESWYLPPSKVNIPFAVDYCRADSSLYFFTTNRSKSHIVKLVGGKANPSFATVLEMPLGAYGFKVVSSNIMWIWGEQDGGWCIWKYSAKDLKLVFKTELAIADVAPLNENYIAVAAGNYVITLGVNQAPKELIKMDVEVDGLAIASDGTLYVSTPKGVLHYLSPEFVEDAEIITYGIHGKIKRYKNSLFVLWQETSQVIEVKL